MAADDIAAMAASGDAGAQKLIDAFARPADLASDHFTYHRWVRVRSLLGVLQRMLRDIHQGATVLDNHPPYPDLDPRRTGLRRAASYRLSDGARAAAVELLDALDALDHSSKPTRRTSRERAPRPEVELRIQPSCDAYRAIARVPTRAADGHVRRRRHRRGRRRHDVRGAGRPARPPRAARRALPTRRREDPHLRRRPLQLHQPARDGPRTTSRSNPDFCRSALARYTPRDFIALVERHGIAYHEKKLGQLFCDGIRARHHRDAEGRVRARRRRVAACRARSTAWRASGDGFRVATSRGPCARASLVIATGGLTVPKIGATPFGYRIAEQFGLAGRAAAAGARAARVRARGARALRRPVRRLARRRTSRAAAGRFRENLLFTHRGLSGPAILQISSYWDGRDAARDRPAARTSTPARGSPNARRVERAPRHAARRAAAEALRAAMVRRARRRAAAARARDRDAARRRCAAASLGGAAVRARSATTRRRSRAGGVDTRAPVVADDGGDATCRAFTSSARSST